jgi:hypothetical protein
VLALAALAATLLVAAGSSSAAGQGKRPVLGVLGSADRFQQQTGQRSTVRHVIMSWSQGHAIGRILEGMRPVPMLGIGTGGTITPLAIAQGRGDTFLAQLNAAIAEFGGLVYVRPLGEMNGHWNEYSAFNQDGSSRGPQNATAAFRKAFARIAVLARGGPKRKLDAALRRLGLPPAQGTFTRTQARIVWNPQGYGSPDIPANSAQAYYPGDAYVDVVANDLYDQRFNAAWDANERLYAAHPGKPYAIAEWGLWGIDDPAFVEGMATFVRTHARVELLSYYSGRPGSVFDLQSKPRSLAAYRRLITPLGR